MTIDYFGAHRAAAQGDRGPLITLDDTCLTLMTIDYFGLTELPPTEVIEDP